MKGALIFAFNNEHIDYVSMAAWSAHRIRRHLGIPVAVITDSKNVPDAFDRVIFSEPDRGNTQYYEDIGSTVSWYNGPRTNAFDLTPWQTTLLIDADYVVASNVLSTFINDSTVDFLCFRNAHSVAYGNYSQLQPTFGTTNFPMWWATVMIFERSRKAEMIFSGMDMVKRNWMHYRQLHGIQPRTYRNDYALSMALALETGHTLSAHALPWSMCTVLSEHRITQLSPDGFEVSWQSDQTVSRRVTIDHQDIHVLCKRHLGEIVATAG